MDPVVKTPEQELKPLPLQPARPEKQPSAEEQKPACVKRPRFEDPGLQMLYESDERIKKFNLWVEELQPGCIFTDARGTHYEYIGMCEENYLFRHAFNAIFTSVEHCDSGDLSHMVNVDIAPQTINFYVTVCGQKVECNKSVLKFMLVYLGLKKAIVLDPVDADLFNDEQYFQFTSIGHQDKGRFPIYTDTKPTVATWAKLRWMCFMNHDK